MKERKEMSKRNVEIQLKWICKTYFEIKIYLKDFKNILVIEFNQYILVRWNKSCSRLFLSIFFENEESEELFVCETRRSFFWWLMKPSAWEMQTISLKKFSTKY